MAQQVLIKESHDAIFAQTDESWHEVGMSEPTGPKWTDPV
jgi:hypothetical protein